MKHLFVPYNLALELKDKGFDDKCFTYYPFEEIFIHFFKDGHNNVIEFKNSDLSKAISAPTHQQVIDWFREKHRIDITQVPSIRLENGWFQFDVTRDKPHIEYFVSDRNYYNALNKAIKEALKLIK